MNDHEQDHQGAASAVATPGGHEASPGKVAPSASLHRLAHPIASGLVSRKADANGVHPGAEHAVAQASDSTTGEPLPGPLAAKFGASLGADLSGVRIHTDDAAAKASAAVGARAYTMGQHIYFARGAYAPSTPEGEKLLAHEVAHTVQQTASGASGALHRDIEKPTNVAMDDDRKKASANLDEHAAEAQQK